MTTSKAPLTEVVASGFSLVIIQSWADKMEAVESVLCKAKIACASARWLTPEQQGDVCAEWSKLEISMREPMVMLAQHIIHEKAARLPFDNVLWIGLRVLSTSPDYALYLQGKTIAQTCGVDFTHHAGAIA